MTNAASATTVPAHTNRLAAQTSPYLLQHAHNPVSWWPWSAEAFEEARRRDVPIFLSIGYSTCYWCHVMERESFESEEIARIMNDRFVCIKVDREERPDVDEVYMAATVMMTGHGGWPMSVFLEPARLRPFWCGTYFPPGPREGMHGPAFPQVLESLSKAYQEQRQGVADQAEQVAAAVIEHLGAAPQPAELGQDQVTQAVSGLLKIFDRVHGGFGSAPKFPQPVFLDFLLDVRTRASDDSTGDAIDQAVRRTLDKMACGGLRDHVGGGFHRYSVDAVWLVPHFEKMLYDNAQLAAVYARAARWYGDQEYTRIAKETLDYVLREVTDVAGGFYSAQDAEVDGREGLNYLWTPQDVRAALDPEDAEFAIRAYGLDQGPNFRDPHHPTEPASNVLRLSDRPERTAGSFSLSHAAFIERLEQVNASLLKARAQRKQPRLDDKVLAAWNGLMIGAMALAAREMEEPRYIAPAKRAAEFILGKMIDRSGARPVLLRSYRAGAATTPAFLEDHAFLIHGLLELHRASPDGGRWLTEARSILAIAKQAFFGGDTGMMYDTREGQADLFVRTRSTHDGAVPSGVSVMINNLIDLAELTGEKAYSKQALTALIANSGAIADSPVGAINSTRALFRLLIATEAAAEALRAQPARVSEQSPSDGHLPVEIYASVDRIAVGAEKPAELTLVIKIPDGYHVPAAEPGDDTPAKGLSLVPFRVGIVSGTGVAAYAGYPQGEEYGSEATGRIRVYKGTLELPVAIERSGDWSGTPLISVMYQACTETECLRPTTVELDIAIDPA